MAWRRVIGSSSGGGGITDATKVVITEDTDTGLYTISSGTFETVGLSIDIDIADPTTQDFKVEATLPSVVGDFGNASMDLGLFADGVQIESSPIDIGNDEISLAPSYWEVRPLTLLAGTRTIDIRIQNTSGIITVDNSQVAGGYMNIQQYEDRTA